MDDQDKISILYNESEFDIHKMLGKKVKFFKVIKQEEQEAERERQISRLAREHPIIDDLIIDRERMKGELELVEELRVEKEALKNEIVQLKKQKQEITDMVSSRITCSVCCRLMVTSLYFTCFSCSSKMCNECLSECAKVYCFEYENVRICPCPHDRVVMPNNGKIGIGGALLPYFRNNDENEKDEKFMNSLRLFSEFYGFIGARLYFRKIIINDFQLETPFLVENGISSVRMGDFNLNGDSLTLQVVLSSFDVDSSVTVFTFSKNNLQEQYEKIKSVTSKIFALNDQFTAEITSIYWFFTFIKSCDSVPPGYVKGLLEKMYDSLRVKNNNSIVENLYDVPFLWYEENGKKLNARQKRIANQRQEELNINN
jgi:hypothetical protein